MRDDNVALMRRAFEAFDKGDLDTIRAMSADGCVWRTPMPGRFKAEYKGPDEVIEYLTELFTLTDGTFKDVPEAFMADDDRVAVLEHITATRLGRTLDTHVVHVFDIRAGKVEETTEFAAEPGVITEFWA